MDKQSQQEYIITKATIKKIIEYSGCEDSVACIKDLLKKESRPHTHTPNLHTCTHKEIRNGVEFCHYYDSPTDPATIAAQAREKVLDELSLPRDAVVRFSRIMENKLCEKDSIRDGWDDCDPVWLFERAEQEMRELKSEITVYMNHSSLSPKWLTIAERVQREAADVANFCMMISDNMESLRKTPKEQP
jgi:hypothetical protein